MRVFHYDIGHFYVDIERMAELIGNERSLTSPVLYTFARGGLIPSTVLSHKVVMPIHIHGQPLSRLDRNSTLIIIDDILDTGKTIHNAIHLLASEGYKIRRSYTLTGFIPSGFGFNCLAVRLIKREDYDYVKFWWEADPQ